MCAAPGRRFQPLQADHDQPAHRPAHGRCATWRACDDYLRSCRRRRRVCTALYQDFLIRVTQFFRDPEAFEALKEKVFPPLVQDRSPASPIRIWVAGCSTGEEVYSLAICLLEYLEQPARTSVPIKILATDLNEPALEKARAGVYLDNIELDVSPERLRRFFMRVDGHYQISKRGPRPVRLLAAQHGQRPALLAASTWSAAATCSSTWTRALQQRVLPMLHYALEPGGFLFLGSLGEHRRVHRPVRAGRRQAPHLTPRSGRRRGMPLDFSTVAAPSRRAARPPGRTRARRSWSAWTCSARPTASCWRATPRSAWWSTRR